MLPRTCCTKPHANVLQIVAGHDVYQAGCMLYLRRICFRVDLQMLLIIAPGVFITRCFRINVYDKRVGGSNDIGLIHCVWYAYRLLILDAAAAKGSWRTEQCV